MKLKLASILSLAFVAVACAQTPTPTPVPTAVPIPAGTVTGNSVALDFTSPDSPTAVTWVAQFSPDGGVTWLSAPWTAFTPQAGLPAPPAGSSWQAVLVSNQPYGTVQYRVYAVPNPALQPPQYQGQSGFSNVVPWTFPLPTPTPTPTPSTTPKPSPTPTPSPSPTPTPVPTPHTPATLILDIRTQG